VEGTEAAGTGAVKEEAAEDWEGAGTEAAEGWEAAARAGEVGSEVAGSGVVGLEAVWDSEEPERPEAVMDRSRPPRMVPEAVTAAAAGSVGETEAAGSMSKARYVSIRMLLLRIMYQKDVTYVQKSPDHNVSVGS